MLITPKGELQLLWGYFFFAATAYLHWAFLVIERFCEYLDIGCLRIAYQDKNGNWLGPGSDKKNVEMAKKHDDLSNGTSH